MESQPSRLECSSDFLGNDVTDRSKNFVKALQELKGLRPQLYSAAEYCEKNYCCGEQKERVVEDLKDYTVHALVNAVDHLGTVASKLSDILEHQTSMISSMDLKLTSLNQQILTCRMVADEEGLRQHQPSVFTPCRHHRRYILPKSADSKQPLGLVFRRDSTPMYSQATPSDSSDHPRTLSWFLDSKQNKESKMIKSDLIRSVDENSPLPFSSADIEKPIRILQHIVLKPEEKGISRRSRLAALFGRHK